MKFQEFESRVQNAKTLDFGDIFNKSIELFKKVWIQGMVMILLSILIILPFYLLMYLPLIGAGIIDPYMFESNTYGQSSAFNPILMFPFFLFMLVFGLIASVISFGMRAGFYRICKMKDLDEAGKEDYFFYLRKPYLSKLIKLSLATFGISLAAILLCYLPIFYVIVPITLMNVIFAFNPEQSVSEIIKSGFVLGNKKWLITFGLIIISSILASIVGMIMCFVGVFITASFAYIPAYYIYKESVGFNAEDENKQIENF
ncbi:hypothetical protein KO494_10010 [Lacinutrix sp. C3R15]|uniref:hypothetical protein n=1 Tax=Flavobacteriaceae TaxID=49546 RepID=UPI001C098834|nr:MULTISPECIES: hypothetical protein [Flavobacteriaceae]MBU2939872.1 hypothetical protein [Lacinutrix sp. C3R15]MDO6623188.1 hypothetical protein [Oceanihabitans sp. 1_MG-2023]